MIRMDPINGILFVICEMLIREINGRVIARTSSSSYSKTSSSSSVSGSSSSGKCALSDTLCIVVPVVSVLGFLLIIGVFIMIYCLKKKCKGCYKKRKCDRIVMNKKKEEENKEAQKSAATKLERIQIELEESTKNSSCSATISLNNTPNQPSQNCITVPGATVQPNYSNVNPYAGHHNNNIIPINYDPSHYGVHYDNPFPPQRPDFPPKNAPFHPQNGQFPFNNYPYHQGPLFPPQNYSGYPNFPSINSTPSNHKMNPMFDPNQSHLQTINPMQATTHVAPFKTDGDEQWNVCDTSVAKLVDSSNPIHS